MKRIAWVDEAGIARKMKVKNKNEGMREIDSREIPTRNWRFITAREWNSPKFRNDEEEEETRE